MILTVPFSFSHISSIWAGLGRISQARFILYILPHPHRQINPMQVFSCKSGGYGFFGLGGLSGNVLI